MNDRSKKKKKKTCMNALVFSYDGIGNKKPK